MANFYVFGRISQLRSINRIIAGKKWFIFADQCVEYDASQWSLVVAMAIGCCIGAVRFFHHLLNLIADFLDNILVFVRF